MDALRIATECWPEGTPLLALPANKPKIVFPTHVASDRARAAGFHPASRVVPRVLRRVLQAQAWSGVGGLKLQGGGGRACEFLDEVERTKPVGLRDCVRIGTAGDTHSVVVRHVDSDGRPLAYSKIAASTRALETLSNEAAVLADLEGRCAPRLLSAIEDAASGFMALCTVALVGKVPRLTEPCPDDLEDCLPLTGAPSALRSHPWVASARWCGEEQLAERALCLAERIPSWPVTTSHGDAAPWNAVRSESGELLLFDWEYATAEGLWLFDRAYWVLQTGRLVRRRTPSSAAAECAAHLAERFPDVRDASCGLTALVALSVAVRMSDDDRAIAGPDSDWWRECASAAVESGECDSR